MKKILSVVALVIHQALGVQAAPPVISNVTASQRPGTKLVDIRYDLMDPDGDVQIINVQVSADGGISYSIPCVTLTGHVGSGVTPGSNRLVTWNAGVDWNGQFVASTKVRITAYDGTTPPPPPGMAYIPAGSFQMGDNLDGETNAQPVHNVHLDAFFIDRFEITKELWQSVQTWGAANGYSISGGSFKASGHPVQTITWYDCVKWCNARSEKEGLTPCYYTDDAQTLVYKTGNLDLTNSQVKWTANGYRLPTEAEWEKAARGGILGLRHPWGNTITGSQANYNGSGDVSEGQSTATTPVGYYNGSQLPAGVDMANGYGLYDMVGNVFEWCWEWYGSTYYGDVAAGNNPRGPAIGTTRVLRGDAWSGNASNLRCSYRGVTSPHLLVSYFGFRCARGL
jgi:formylglycine-generating enzyme required for sulfatase activity